MVIEIKEQYAKEYCQLVEQFTEGKIAPEDLLKQLPVHHLYYLLKGELKKEPS